MIKLGRGLQNGYAITWLCKTFEVQPMVKNCIANLNENRFTKGHIWDAKLFCNTKTEENYAISD